MLSVFIITRNEERHIERCLASVRDLADEIVVLDSGSADRTVELAMRAGARVESRPFDDFGRQKQAALHLTRGDWVLSLDADEELTPGLAAEIRATLAVPPDADGFAIRRTLTYLGTDLRYGGTGSDWVVRLARRDRVHIKPVPVHESLVVAGRVARLRHTMRHRKYLALSEHVETINRYTSAIAAEKRAAGVRFSSWHLLRLRWEVFSRLILRLGILDGRAGVIHAVMSAHYAFLKYAKLFPDDGDDSLTSSTDGS
jgi:glycosyltransferase involved in cell wall biosynthesis